MPITAYVALRQLPEIQAGFFGAGVDGTRILTKTEPISDAVAQAFDKCQSGWVKVQIETAGRVNKCDQEISGRRSTVSRSGA
jgi:hypothetical protein